MEQLLKLLGFGKLLKAAPEMGVGSWGLGVGVGVGG
jgi:hypothetical protein